MIYPTSQKRIRRKPVPRLPSHSPVTPTALSRTPPVEPKLRLSPQMEPTNIGEDIRANILNNRRNRDVAIQRARDFMCLRLSYSSSASHLDEGVVDEAASNHEEDILSSQPVEHAVRSRPDDEKQHRDFTSASQRRRRLPKVARPPTPPLPTSHKRLRSQLDDMRSRSVSPEHVHHKLPVQPPLFRDPTTVMSPEGTLCGSDDDHQSKPFFRPACYRWSIRSSKCSMAGRSCASRAASMRMVCRRFARWGSTIRLKLNRILGLALPPAVVTY